jgi:hypothetical protein
VITVGEAVSAAKPVGSAALAELIPTIPPRLKAATVTSAMRLKVVFVDICFLSIKVTAGNFPPVAWPRSAFS